MSGQRRNQTINRRPLTRSNTTGWQRGTRGRSLDLATGRGGHMITSNDTSGSGLSENQSFCGMCNLITTENAIGCDKCDLWFHPEPRCTGLKATLIACIM